MSKNPLKNLNVVSSLGLIGYILFVFLSIPRTSEIVKSLVTHSTVDNKVIPSKESDIALGEYSYSNQGKVFPRTTASDVSSALMGTGISDFDKKINSVKDTFEHSTLQPSKEIHELNKNITAIKNSLDRSLVQPNKEISDINTKVTSIKNSLDQAENYRKFKILAAIMLNLVFGLYGLHFELSEEKTNHKLGKIFTTILVCGNTLLGFI